MLVNDLMELSALLAINGSAFVLGNGEISDHGAQRYWELSRARLQRWQQSLSRFQLNDQATSEEVVESRRPRLLPTVEEIFTSEVLTRVFAAIACEYDCRRGSSAVTPVVSSVLQAHMDARRQAMTIMVQARVKSMPAVVDLNRLRLRAERWTDMLLAHLFPACHVENLVFEYRRVLDFAEEFCDEEPIVIGNPAWDLMVSGLKAAFRGLSAAPSLNEDLNRQIVSSVLACFEPSALESVGMLKTLWMNRMDHAADETQTLIDALLAIENSDH